jgi:hypothetical protein
MVAKKIVKKSVKKSVPKRDPIGDGLAKRERSKYGPNIVGNEAQYMPGDRSRALKGYSRVTGYIPRSGPNGGSGGSSLYARMTGGGLRNQGK